MLGPDAMARLTSLLLPFATALLVSACGGQAGVDDPAPAAKTDATSTQPTMSAPAFCASSPADDALPQRIFAQLAPRVSADYLALRRFEISVPTPSETDAGLVTLLERGKLCATAADPARCTKSYNALAYEAPWSPIVYFTRGDEVGVVKSAANAVTLLGGVDSAEEAFFVAGLAGFRFSCGGSNPAAYRATDDGFEIATEVGGCGKPRERVVVHVHASGAIDEVSRTTTEAVTSECAQP